MLCFLVFSIFLWYNIFILLSKGDIPVEKSTELSKQQLKSKETKERIFQAAKNILQRSGYENLSIKNICEEAGVSNGSFYHHFQSKDDLLSYHVEEQPAINPELLEIPTDKESAKAAIVEVYLNYASYCYVLGVDFIAGYYHTKNQALNPDIRTERPYPIVTVQQYLEKAVAANAIQLKLSIEEVVTDIRMLVIGNAFEWALRNGEVDLKENIRRSISHYLDGVLM